MTDLPPHSGNGVCAGCGRPRPPESRFCFNCGHPVAAADHEAIGDPTTGPNDTSIRLPRVVVPTADTPLASEEAQQPAQQTSGAEDAYPPPSRVPYGVGPRFPLYADEVDASAAPPGSSTPGSSTPGYSTPGYSTPGFATSERDAAAPAGPSRRASRVLPTLVVVLAVLLIAGVIGGVVLVGAGDDTPEADTRPSDTASGAADEPSDAVDPDDPDDAVSRPPEVVVDDPRSLADLATPAASNTGSPGTSLAGEAVTYEVANVLDGDPGTTWRVEGDGSGETLTFTFDEEVAITSLGLVNGYAKVDEHDGERVDWYERNRVVIEVRWTFDDGSVFEQDFRRDPAPQTVEVPATLTRSVELEIVGVSGHNGADRTPISEVVITGAPASETTQE